ncbi:MHYT domain-containing protein [Frankia sp. AiPs1]|uniref:MHYT domain-containing protein n=1 Tax=Frankia sp. AiPa1 TaxID=573492 RepID=UPI00202B6373|nr:MHYT domain-containing protein [Frankia sp. AiPa1]MCL9760262.1 histidine kinase [Frankia sp. AiPa1]
MIVAAAAHQHSSQDLLFVIVSVGLALVGSFAALVSAIRIPLSDGRERARWTAAAAVSLGGGAIWSMHFIGMIGYQVDGLDLRYGLPYTGLSLLIAIAGSGLGLTLVGRHPRSLGWLMSSGLVAGLGVAAMHYTGMAAMHTGGDVTYRMPIVVLSVVIAVAAATAALWIAFRVRTGRHVVVASMVMATAVCGMHYTAMAAARVSVDLTLIANDDLHVSGTDPIALAPMVCVIAFSVLAVVIFAAMGGVTESGALSMARASQVRPGALVLPIPPASDEYFPPAPVPVWRNSFSEPPSNLR